MSQLIDTKKASRRQIRYHDLDQLVADEECLLAADAPTTGNWSKGKIMEHIAKIMDMTVEGFPFTAPWIVRFISRHFLKDRFIRNGMPSGFKPSKGVAKHVMPDDSDPQAALEHLRTTVARLKALDHNAQHTFFGELTPDEARAINQRHAELHMSFITEPNGAS